MSATFRWSSADPPRENVRKNWRRRPDLNRGWRFCSPAKDLFPWCFSAYDERTRHTNADLPERMSEDELEQSAIVMATFAWQAAVRDEKIPRMPAR